MNKKEFIEHIESYDYEGDKIAICDFLYEKFGDLYDDGKYDNAIEFLDGLDFDNIPDKGIPMWMMTASNPISPLMRHIPLERKVLKLQKARCDFWDRAIKYYDSIDYQLSGRSMKPKNHEQVIKEYDLLWGGQAPKEIE